MSTPWLRFGDGDILILSRPRANAKGQRLSNVSGDYIQLHQEGVYRAGRMWLVIIDSGECKLFKRAETKRATRRIQQIWMQGGRSGRQRDSERVG
jgi:hypothetical protein